MATPKMAVGTRTRLFGGALAGVKKLKLKRNLLIGAAEVEAKRRAGSSLSAGVKRKQAFRQPRGRGNISYQPSLVGPASHPVMKVRGRGTRAYEPAHAFQAPQAHTPAVPAKLRGRGTSSYEPLASVATVRGRATSVSEPVVTPAQQFVHQVKGRGTFTYDSSPAVASRQRELVAVAPIAPVAPAAHLARRTQREVVVADSAVATERPSTVKRLASRRAAPYEEASRNEAAQRAATSGLRQHGAKGAAQSRWSHDNFDGPQSVGSSIFIRSLPRGADASQLEGIFRSVGEIASVQVDDGPIPTATVAFVRRDAAVEAERRFHGRWIQGVQLKVSIVKSLKISHDDDDEFWRHELTQMRKAARDGHASLDVREKASSGVVSKASLVSNLTASPVARVRRGRGNFVARGEPNSIGDVVTSDPATRVRRGRGSFMAHDER